VCRIIGNRLLPNMDPFLMLDLFNVKLPAGFPDHPHRGFETVTYMLEGEVEHEDFKGHRGKIGPGDVQWMTAGKGIVHAEMPSSFDKASFGFQLWINLDRKNKFCDPKYQEHLRDKIPTF
jgi:quercetin 2,3-dioxygenase